MDENTVVNGDCLPPGRSLQDVVDDVGSTSLPACEIGIAVADALAVLHARPLIHGSVRADRVWMAEDGQVILLRDPSGPPLAPRDDSSASWFDLLTSPASYAAPEFAAHGQACDQATDIYSLGCLLFRLHSGRNPADRGSFDETIAAHASQTPPELAEAVAQGESGDPLYRVIAFAMAKSPGARFASAEHAVFGDVRGGCQRTGQLQHADRGFAGSGLELARKQVNEKRDGRAEKPDRRRSVAGVVANYCAAGVATEINGPGGDEIPFTVKTTSWSPSASPSGTRATSW